MNTCLKLSFILLTFMFILKPPIHAYTDKGYYAGLAYYSDNFLSKTTQKPTGEKSLLGTPDYPIVLKYDFKAMNYFSSAKFTWNILGRKGVGDTVKSETMHLYFPIGKNFASSSWDWGIGPGIMRQTIKGAGGVTQMSNGAGTATFAVPGRSSTSQLVTLNFVTSYTQGKSVFGIDLVSEGAMSSSKRTFNLMLSYTYRFSGSGRGGR